MFQTSSIQLIYRFNRNKAAAYKLRTPGVFIEKVVHNYLCIETLNSHLIFSCLTYSDAQEQFDEIYIRFTATHGRLLLRMQ